MKISGTNLTMIRGDTESIAVTCTKDGVNYLELGDCKAVLKEALNDPNKNNPT